jgi:hypothetical protein
VVRAAKVVGKDIVALRSKKTWGYVDMAIARNGKMNLKENENLLGMEVGEEEVVQVSPGSLGMMMPMTEIHMAPNCPEHSQPEVALAAAAVEGETAMVVDALAEGPLMSRH